MQGKIVIEAKDNTLTIEGAMGFNGRDELFELIADLAEASQITSLDEWAKLACYALTRGKNPENKSVRYEIKVPRP